MDDVDVDGVSLEPKSTECIDVDSGYHREIHG